MKFMQVYIICIELLLSACFTGGLAKKEDKPISEDKDVLVLTENNLSQALKQYSQLLVHFYATLSGESLGSILEFAKAASELKKIKSSVKLGKIDVSKEKDLAKSLNVTTVPSIRLYLSGNKHNPVQCPVLKSSTAILTWLKRREGPSAEFITDLSQLESLTAEEEIVVLGLFKDVEMGLVKVFYDVAGDIADLPFCVTGSEQIFSKYDIFDDSVVLLRKKKMAEIFEMTNQTVKEDVIHFIRVHEMPLVTEYNGETSSKILQSVVQNHLVLFIDKAEKGFKQIYRSFRSSAKEYRGKGLQEPSKQFQSKVLKHYVQDGLLAGKYVDNQEVRKFDTMGAILVLFVLIDTGEHRNGRILEYFRVRTEDSPLIRMVNLTDNLQYQLPSDQLDMRTITDFCQSYFLGNAKPKLQSEPIPNGWDKQPVKELVGVNFEKVAFNENKNVLVLFYAAWNSESRALFPLFEELAKHFSDTEDVVVARIDVTTNDVNIRMLDRYPTIKLFPAVYAERVVSYSGQTKLEPIVEFVNAERARAEEDKAKEEIERKKYLDAQKAATKEEL